MVGIPHPKWDERPLAFVVLKEGQTVASKTFSALLQGISPSGGFRTTSSFFKRFQRLR